VAAHPATKGSSARAAIGKDGTCLLLRAVAFITGWTIMMLEILGGRLLAPFFGYSVYQWGALIGVVMAALAIGYYLGGRVGDRPEAGRFLLGALVVSLIFILVVPRLADSFMPAMRALGPAWGSVAASIVLLGVPSLLLATTSPIVIRLTASALIADSAGRVYAVSTVGSIGGTFFTAFYAIPDLGTRMSHYVAAALLAAAAIALALVERQTRMALVAVVVFALGFPFGREGEPGDIYRAESVHNIIRVSDVGPWRYLYLNYAAGAQTVMNKNGLLTDRYYDEFLIGPQINGAKNVLFLGVAGGTAIKQLVTVYPDVRVTGVDLDPAVLDVARRYFGLGDEKRVTLVADDARWYLANSRDRYDMIAIDLYVTGHIPFFVTTEEFFRQVYDHLTPNGILMMNVLAVQQPEELLGPLVRTVRRSFPSTFLTGYGNFILIASRSTLGVDTLRARLREAGPGDDIKQVARRALNGLSPASAGPEWPLFTDDKNDVEFRTFRTFYGGY
jgi:predicted membrane-bound spermidine synthase